MAKNQKIECVSYIRGAEGGLIPFSTLTPEEKQAVRERISENVGKALSDFFTQHPEELEPYSHAQGVRLIPDS